MNQEVIGKKIKKIRIDNKLTQREFADSLGVTYQAVSKWENGKNLPDIAIMKDICDKYNFDFNELINENSSNKKTNNKFKLLSLITLIIIILVFIFIFIFLIFKGVDNFHFGTINTTCDDFEISGSVAYNSNKTNIYISDVKYCGEETNEVYDRIEANLFISKNNIDNNIYNDTKYNISLNDYLDNFSMQVNSNICLNFDGELTLSIYAYDESGKATIYKIPLTMNESCF